MSNTNDQHEEYLRKFSTPANDESLSYPVNNGNDNVNNNNNDDDNISYSSSENSLEYLNVELSMLPLGMFYKQGTKIKIRAAKVYEVQAYSVVDDKNILDVTEKMNQMLSSCIKFVLPNGKNGTYRDIKDGDRLFLIFMIRELTFQKGNSLSKEVTCENCKHEFPIPFRSTANPQYPKTFTFYQMPDKLKPFFNAELKCFEFPIDGVSYKMCPPTIGIQEIFYNDIRNKVQNKKTPNVSFLKIIPYLLWDKSTISEDGIKAKEQEFRSMKMDTFQFINQAVDKMLFGIEGLTINCPSCGEEVHSDMTFPEGASSLFVISDSFNNIVKK